MNWNETLSVKDGASTDVHEEFLTQDTMTLMIRLIDNEIRIDIVKGKFDEKLAQFQEVPLRESANEETYQNKSTPPPRVVRLKRKRINRTASASSSNSSPILSSCNSDVGATFSSSSSEDESLERTTKSVIQKIVNSNDDQAHDPSKMVIEVVDPQKGFKDAYNDDPVERVGDKKSYTYDYDGSNINIRTDDKSSKIEELKEEFLEGQYIHIRKAPQSQDRTKVWKNFIGYQLTLHHNIIHKELLDFPDNYRFTLLTKSYIKKSKSNVLEKWFPYIINENSNDNSNKQTLVLLRWSKQLQEWFFFGE